MSFASSSPGIGGIRSTVISAVFFGVTFSAWLAYQRESVHKALVEAVAGVDKIKRCQAIAAITHSVVPADPTVRSVAIQLGSAYLGGRSAAQLRRQERQTWMVLALLAAGSIVAAVLESGQP